MSNQNISAEAKHAGSVGVVLNMGSLGVHAASLSCEAFREFCRVAASEVIAADEPDEYRAGVYNWAVEQLASFASDGFNPKSLNDFSGLWRALIFSTVESPYADHRAGAEAWLLAVPPTEPSWVEIQAGEARSRIRSISSDDWVEAALASMRKGFH